MEICQEVMACNKTLATTYTVAALESADPSIRRTFRQMGRDCERVAYRAFEILHTQGHYEVKSAPSSEVRNVEDMLQSFLRGQAVPNAQEPRPPQNNWQRGAGLETERTYAGERSFGNERPFAGERGYASERPYERAYDADRTVGAGAGSYAGERSPASYGSVRAERTDLPDWARSRS